MKVRRNGITYKKSENKKKLKLERLKKLVYSNFNLTNKELASKLEISEKEFYRSKYNLVANELRKKFKSQSLF